MEKSNYKYIHILIAGNDKGIFYDSMLEVLNDSNNGFNINDQLFVVLNAPLYEKINLPQYSNVLLFNGSNKGVDAINAYGDKGEWLIIHGMVPVVDSFRIKRKYRRKIIWRTWGHDTGFKYKKGDIRNVPKFFLNALYRSVIKSFYAVAVAPSSIDRNNVKELFGNVKLLNFSYASPKRCEILNKVYLEPGSCNDSFSIMLGHSGLSQDNHLQILDHLKKFRDNDIKIYIPLAYGKKEYIDSIKNGVDCQFWGDKVVIIDTLVTYEEYVRFIKRIDLAILDGLGSAALGNLAILRFFGKRLCVNKDGIMHRALVKDGISHFTIDELCDLSFEQLSKPVYYTDEQREIPQDSVEMWHEFYSSLK